MLTFQKTDSTNPDFASLVKELDADLAIRDGDDHAFYSQFNKVDNIREAIICFSDGELAGCGAFKPYSETEAEIKRMYVKPAFRGKRVGLAILSHLEEWARSKGYKKAILETGIKQPEAIRLYQNAGFTLIENYGQYEGVVNSVCMMKKLL